MADLYNFFSIYELLDTAAGTLVSFSMNPDIYNGKVSLDVGEINVSLIVTEGGH